MARPSKGAFEALRAAYNDRIDFDTPMPLVRGIGDELIKDGKLTQSRVRCALAYHTDTLEYLMAVLEQEHRVGLDPNIQEPIRDLERTYTRRRFTVLFQRLKTRIADLLQVIKERDQDLAQHRKIIRQHKHEIRVMQKNINRLTTQKQQIEAAYRKLTGEDPPVRTRKPKKSKNAPAPEAPVAEAPAQTTVIVHTKKRQILKPTAPEAPASEAAAQKTVIVHTKKRRILSKPVSPDPS